MDHRSGSRLEIVIPVEVSGNQKSHGRYLSSNIGHGGLLLNFQGELKKGDMLTVKIPDLISSPDSCPACRHQLKALVIHKSDSHVGLMWADYNIPFFNQLELLLSGVASYSQTSAVFNS